MRAYIASAEEGTTMPRRDEPPDPMTSALAEAMRHRQAARFFDEVRACLQEHSTETVIGGLLEDPTEVGVMVALLVCKTVLQLQDAAVARGESLRLPKGTDPETVGRVAADLVTVIALTSKEGTAKAVEKARAHGFVGDFESFVAQAFATRGVKPHRTATKARKPVRKKSSKK
jgi:hypothetical protein